MSDSPRTEALYAVLTAPFASPVEAIAQLFIHARQLERELALKDADLFLERDRAEKAEQELVESQKAYQAAHSELETSNNQLGACKRVANALQPQVKMLVEALQHEQSCRTCAEEGDE